MPPTFSAWSIRRPLPALVISIVLLLWGAIGFGAVAVARLPNADTPVISISISQPGATPTGLAAQVARPVEDAVSSIEGRRHVTSTIADGTSVTLVQFQAGTDADHALNAVRDAVAGIRAHLPQAIIPPNLQRVDVVGLSILTYAVTAPDSTPEQLSSFVDDVVKPTLQGLHGVGRVERIGGVQRELAVSLDPDRLQAMDLTAADVSRQLRGIALDVTAGRAQIGDREQSIRTLTGATTVNGIAASMIGLPSGGRIRLGDLGSVTNSIVEPTTFARVDDRSIVGFKVLRSKSASDVAVADGVANKIAEIRAAHPDIDLQLLETSADFTAGQSKAAIRAGLAGFALAIVVVFVVLRDLRATLIVAIALPLAVVPGFWAMAAFGVTLNVISLLAIALSIGVVFDDCIVETENIERHLAMGKSPIRAAVGSACEIEPAAVAASLAIIAIFGAVGLGNIAGNEVLRQFGVTISVFVAFSLLVARFVTPVLAAYLLKPRFPGGPDEPPSATRRSDAGVLRSLLRHPYIVVAIGLLLLAPSILGMRLLPSAFLPPQDVGRSLLAIELPPGAQLSATRRVTEEIVQRLRARSDVRSVVVEGGRIPPSSVEVRKASLSISYAPRGERAMSQRQLEQSISRDLEAVPDIRHWFLDEKCLRGVGLVVTGQDPATVGNVAAELVAQMQRIPLIDNIVSSASLDRPELVIRPRPDLAAHPGLSMEALADTIRIATVGDVGPGLAKLNPGDIEMPLRVRLDTSVRENPQLLEQVRVPLSGGRGTLPLGAVADLSFERGPIDVTRLDREIQAAVGADLVGDAVVAEAMAEIAKLPVMRSLPRGISVKQSGQAGGITELVDGFATASRIGLLAGVVLLIVVFGGLSQPITLLISLPLSVGAAFIGLLVTHTALSVPVFVGLLLVTSIVAKNAVLLIYRALVAIRRGKPRETAVLEAAQARARPIVMTAAAIFVAMLPSAFMPGAGAEIRAAMAITVLGGVLSSTLVSLIFVPAALLVMDDFGALLQRVTSKHAGPGRTRAASEP